MRGPAFGTNKFTSAIDHVGGVPDADDYVAWLAADETLTADVLPDAGSSLRPKVQLIDPDGNDALAPTTPLKGGPGMRLDPIRVGRTGKWAVRVSGTTADEGTYSVRFRISTPKALSASGTVGGTQPLAVDHEIEAVNGSVLTLTLASGGKTPAGILSFTGPDGAPVPDLPLFTKSAGSKTTVKGLPLLAGSGKYKLRVGRADGAASYKLRWTLKSPARPSGTTAISADEPYITFRTSPLDGQTGKPVQLSGAHFSTLPYPTLLIDGAPASILGVGASTTTIDFIPPAGLDNAVVPVTVVNPDGQATTRNAYFRFVPASVPPLAAITPSPFVVYATETSEFFINLSLPAPPAGLGIALTGTPGIGSYPSTITAAGNSTSVRVGYTAPATSRTGTITATSGNSIVTTVQVLPARKVDLSGWRINQVSPVVSFIIPNGTVIDAGGYLIVARGAARAAFELYWQRTLGSNVLFVDSVGKLPLIDGAETFTLTDQYGTVIDGPSRTATAGINYNRRAGQAAGLTASWIATTASTFNATPGTGQSVPVNPAYLYVSEFSDVPSGGDKNYQFVEIHFDRAP